MKLARLAGALATVALLAGCGLSTHDSDAPAARDYTAWYTALRASNGTVA